jgi:hypothetical protein
MANRLRRGACAALSILCATCGSSNETTAPPLTVTASIGPGSVASVTNGVKANGNNLVSILVTGATRPPIRLTTGRGVFPGGQRSLLVEGTSATVNLIVCDARSDNNCGGTTTVTATDAAGGFGQVQVTFVGYETSCNDLRDENRDNRTDCADPDCDAAECVDVQANTGVCQQGACIPASCQPISETEVCDNALDDDCDRAVDCEQSSCDGQPCKAGSPGFTCQSRVCTEVGSGYGMTLTAVRPRLPADGTSTTAVRARVIRDGAAQVGFPVDFTTDAGTLLSTTAVTGADGTASVVFQAPATAGTATITASLRGGLSQVKATALVDMPTLGSISIGAMQTQVMGVKFSGFNEQNQISVLVLDAEQRPYPDGLAVRFEHKRLGGSTISTPHTGDTETCLAANGCLGFQGVTASAPGRPDMQGLATVSLFSGTAAGPVIVTVSATAGGVTRNFTIQNVAVVGAKASGLHTSLRCEQRNQPGYREHDCTNSFEPGAAFQCTVFLADRFNNVLGVATRADFRSEAGSPGPPVVTKAFDPTREGDQSAELGWATNSVLVTGYKLPADVPPQEDEYSETYDSGCGLRNHNPRDGYGSVLVAVPGEEGFVDLNGNGVYDAGEPFVDGGEPFVDEDDSGIRESDEPFIDVNQSGSWDGPNGVWDASTVIWAEDRVAYTGHVGRASRWYDLADELLLPGETPPVSYEVGLGAPQSFGVFFSDARFNPLAPGAEVSLSPALGDAMALFVRAPVLLDYLGASFTQLFCDQPPPATGATCNSTCKSAPCYRVSRISSFGYGWPSVATITAGPTKGPGIIQATTVIAEEPEHVSISGVTK